MENRLEILLVEDDQSACYEIVKEADNSLDDFFIIGVTNNSARAYQYVIEAHPDAVILDLELHHGGGDGLEFLKQIKESNLIGTPFILVTTNNISTVTHRIARELGADFIMTKNQDGYSAKSVLDFLKITKSVILSKRTQNRSTIKEESPTQKTKRIQRRICNELNKVGISPKSVGYKYLIDAITITVQEPAQHICNIIGNKYGKSENSVERAMQNAINRAWKTSDINDLLANYTAKIRSEKGAPTLTEFIYYYAQKIENDF
ncbi:MAG: sporulation initiation factor Spo0A C-terminal domain-containing protein [Candidatus Coproplasma sp.]